MIDKKEVLVQALNRYGIRELFESNARAINLMAESQNDKEGRLKVLLEVTNNLLRNHVEAQKRYSENMSLVLEKTERCVEMLKHPPAINFNAPQGFLRQQLKARDDWLFSAGYIASAAKAYECLAGDPEKLLADGKHLDAILEFTGQLQEQTLPIPIMMAHIKRGLHEEHSAWSEEKLDAYLTEHWGSLMEEVKRRGLKITLEKGGQ
jgi:hypothetical protein